MHNLRISTPHQLQRSSTAAHAGSHGHLSTAQNWRHFPTDCLNYGLAVPQFSATFSIDRDSSRCILRRGHRHCYSRHKCRRNAVACTLLSVGGLTRALLSLLALNLEPCDLLLHTLNVLQQRISQIGHLCFIMSIRHAARLEAILLRAWDSLQVWLRSVRLGSRAGRAIVLHLIQGTLWLTMVRPRVDRIRSPSLAALRPAAACTPGEHRSSW